MDQLIQAFGIDVKLITVQIINFAILLVLLSYFLYKPVLKVLADREATIKKGIKDAEAAAKAKADASTEKKAILSTAHTEAEEISARAAEHGEEKANTIVAKANDQAEQIVRDAEVKGKDIQTRARKESEAEITKLAVLAAEKVLRADQT